VPCVEEPDGDAITRKISGLGLIDPDSLGASVQAKVAKRACWDSFLGQAPLLYPRAQVAVPVLHLEQP
jgi:hypothetical protein